MLSLVHVVDSVPPIHHNEIRDFTASLLSEVYSDVGVEPALQPFDHEPLRHATANREDGAHLDGAAGGGIGSVRSLTLVCLILFHAIPISHCQDT